MSKENHVIFGVHITDRVYKVSSVQEALTEYGCSIRTRLGLHEAGEGFCSPNGLMILEMVGSDDEQAKLFDALNAIKGVEAQKMIFDHP